MLQCILEEYDPNLLNKYSIVKRGSFAEIIRTLDSIPPTGHPFLFAGILDGDQRSQKHPCSWPINFLIII
jgi:hypothetical protein